MSRQSMNTPQDIKQAVAAQARLAKQAARSWALLATEQKNEALQMIAEQLKQDESAILAANEQDMRQAEADGRPASYLDRLQLTPKRIDDLVESLHELVKLADPVGSVVERWTRPNGMTIQSVRVPLGVVGMIYEARPNVTVDAAAIALKTGNAIVLRGSSSARHSNTALANSIRTALEKGGLAHEAVQYLAFEQHESVDAMCTANGLIDVIIPRGGADLIQRVVRNSSVPVIETGVGNCHVYVDASADAAMAEAIVHNAKTHRPGVCNAAETLLLHADWPTQHSQQLLEKLLDSGVELRVCDLTRERHPQLADRLLPATESDWLEEYLSLTMAVRTVASVEEALQHIAQYSSGHSEAIVCENQETAQLFLAAVDAACVYHNVSTRFTDGGEFGFGAEIGISTQKLHVRGPMGLPALTSIKYQIMGDGQIR